MLRRLARLELMKNYGRKWLISVNSLYDTIEPRISSDIRAGIYDSTSSELSYLTLNELSNFVFKILWSTIFKNIFNSQLSYLSDIQLKVSPLRNKVAHFRPIKTEDLFNTKIIFELRERLREYYSDPSLTQFYIPSDPCNYELWIDSEIISEVMVTLSSFNHERIWEVMDDAEPLRKYGFSFGLGVFNGHLFVEFYKDGDFPVTKLDDYMNANKELISFISLNANKLRIFFPLKNECKDNSKLIRSAFKVLAVSQSTSISLQKNFSDVSEHFIGPNIPATFSFAI